jgi:hypothetical protein
MMEIHLMMEGLTYTQRCILDVAGFSMFFNLGKSDLLQNSIFGYC